MARRVPRGGNGTNSEIDSWLLREIEEALCREFGEAVRVIVRNLPEEGILEEDFLKKVDYPNVSHLRRTMYKLYEKGIVTFERQEVRRRWWIYKWKFRLKNAIRYVLEMKEKELRELVRILDQEMNTKFFCPSCGRKYSYDEALFFGFKCESCGEVLKDYEPNVDGEIKKRISKLEEEILTLRKYLE